MMGLYGMMKTRFHCLNTLPATCTVPALSTVDVQNSLKEYGLFGVVGGANSDPVSSLGLDPAWGLEPDESMTWK